MDTGIPCQLAGDGVAPTGPGRRDHWGPLAERFLCQRPRRLLALDGGGIRGLVTLQVLRRIEEIVQRHRGDHARLSDFYDYIGGTSSGAIIAAGLARGMRVDEIAEFYRRFGSIVFRSRPFFLGVMPWAKAKYDTVHLEQALKDYVTETADLHPSSLETLLLVVMRNATTDSLWPIMSNPEAMFNDLALQECNLSLPLWQLLRASAAAPTYFPPRIIEFGSQQYVFVDGGTTPHNNPSMLLYRAATCNEYRLGWERGEEQLLLTSVGSGRPLAHLQLAADPELRKLGNAKAVIAALIGQANVEQDTNCRVIGRCSYGLPIDDEIGDLIPRDETGAPVPLYQDLNRAFLYHRYDCELTPEGLATLGLEHLQPRSIAKLDSVRAMDELERVGTRIAAQVEENHFGPFLAADEP